MYLMEGRNSRYFKFKLRGYYYLMSLIDGGKALSGSVSIKTTTTRHGSHSDKHCFAGTCDGKKYSGSSMSKHLKAHVEKNEEKNILVCDGQECGKCSDYELSKGKYP